MKKAQCAPAPLSTMCDEVQAAPLSEGGVLNDGLPLSVRMKTAIEAVLYCHPKLSATANLSGEEFSARLDQAIARSGGMTPRLPRPTAEGGADHSAVTDKG